MSFETDHVREDFRPFVDFHWPRFLWNLNPRNLWADEPNPYDLPKMRGARSDLGHSYVNLFVEGWRASAYLVGHILAVAVPFGVLALTHGIVLLVASL